MQDKENKGSSNDPTLRSIGHSHLLTTESEQQQFVDVAPSLLEGQTLWCL